MKILEIKDVSTLTVLAQFDEQTKKIDLEPLKSYIGEKVIISHFNKHNKMTALDYEHVKAITDVGQDSNGIWYFQYN